MTENTKSLWQRIAAVMEEVTYIQKERKAGMQYNIVTHDKVTAKVRPALLRHGVIYYPIRCDHTQNGNRAECSMTVRFVNVDAPEEFIDVQTFGYGVDSQDKGPGKAMSYAVKYALLKMLGLETGDDPDQDNLPHVDEQKQAMDFLKEMLGKAVDADGVNHLLGKAKEIGTKEAKGMLHARATELGLVFKDGQYVKGEQQ